MTESPQRLADELRALADLVEREVPSRYDIRVRRYPPETTVLGRHNDRLTEPGDYEHVAIEVHW